MHNQTTPSLLQNRDFMKLWTGQTISEFGSRITRDGIPLIAVITLTASPEQIGILTAASGIPVLLFGLFAGVWVDRLPRRPIMIATDLLRFAMLCIIPIAALGGWLSMPLLYVITSLASILGLLFEAAYRALLPSLVTREQLVDGNSKLATTDSLAEIGGPAIAGLLIQVFTAPFAIIFDALTYLVSASSFTLIRTRETAPIPEDEPNMLKEIHDGMRVIAVDPILRTIAIGTGVRGFFGSFIGTLYALFAVRDLGLSPALLGILIAGGGIGALFGAVVSKRITQGMGVGSTIIASLLVGALANFLIPLAGGPLVIIMTMMIIGQIVGDAAMTIFFINEISLRQSIIPERMLGRANTTIGFLAQGVAPLGALIGGAVGGSIGARGTLWIAAIGILLTALWMAQTPLRRATIR